MALSADFIETHITFWERRLSDSFRSYRGKWPSRLFHHAPVENAAEILKTGRLLSRNQSHGVRPKDVAGQDVIALRPRAHEFARFYFRPRTPTQFHIEGVKKPREYFNGQASAHAPTLVMLVFDARSVLQTEGVRFSNCNMQSSNAIDSDTEAFFDSIDFERVFHEGGTGGDQSITSCRQAEVLAKSPLPLKPHLQWIYCRSTAERQSLLHLLGDQADEWRPQIKVSDDIQVFEKRHVYVEEVTIQSNGLLFQLHPRLDGAQISVEVNVWNGVGQKVLEYGPNDMNALPGDPKSKRWWLSGELAPGTYLVEIKLETCVAFQAQMSFDPLPF